MQIKDNDHARRIEESYVCFNSTLVISTRVTSLDIRITIPAGLIQRHPNRIYIPALHRNYRGLIAWAIENTSPVDTLVLCPGSVYTVQDYLFTLGIKQPVT